MKLSNSILIIFLVLNCFYYSALSQSSATISSISNIYRGITQTVTLTGTNFAVNTNLTLKNTFTYYGVVIQCPSTVFINNNSMTCEIPSSWASDYTQVAINNTYTSRYLSVTSATISYVNITSSNSIQVTGDALMVPINSAIQLQLNSGIKYNLSCDVLTQYKSYSCQIPFDNLLVNCFRINYIDSYYSPYINIYTDPELISVELLGNALKIEADTRCPSNSPTLGLTINSIPFSSNIQSSGINNLYLFTPSFTLCTDYSKLFNITLSTNFYSSTSGKFNSNMLQLDCTIGRVEIDIPSTSSSSDSTSSTSSVSSSSATSSVSTTTSVDELDSSSSSKLMTISTSALILIISLIIV